MESAVLPGRDRYSLRTLESYGDFEQVAGLQMEALGLRQTDVFPPKLMKVAVDNGGAVVGTFDSAGKLVAFVFNFPGHRYGRPIEWSYLIAVAPGQRGRGLERRLKLAQRLAALERGFCTVCWAFDPLDAAAARRNLHRLGALVDEYAPDFPDPMSGPLYNRFTSDRLIAVWNLDDPHVAARLASEPQEAKFPDEVCLIEPAQLEAGRGPPCTTEADRDGDVLAFPSPADYAGLRRTSQDAARSWRLLTRATLGRCFSRGYVASGFAYRQPERPDWGWYVLRRNS